MPPVDPDAWNLFFDLNLKFAIFYFSVLFTMGPADVLLGRVLRLGCPAAANLHHGPLLLSPGAVRLEIIEWLFER